MKLLINETTLAMCQLVGIFAIAPIMIVLMVQYA